MPTGPKQYYGARDLHFDSYNNPQQDPGREDEGARVPYAQLDEEPKGWDVPGRL